jgi:geranylgeranyl transferase type-2 subunit beta
MALVSGPGRAGGGTGDMPPEMRLFVDKHVAYIQSLDTVRSMRWPCLLLLR